MLDTNVLIAAMLSPYAPPATVLSLILAERVVLCIDTRVVTEYREVVRRPKFGIDGAFATELIDHLEEIGEPVVAVPLDLELPDASDAMFLEVAVAGLADYLVTGNLKHFPAKARCGVRVRSPRQFVDLVKS